MSQKIEGEKKKKAPSGSTPSQPTTPATIAPKAKAPAPGSLAESDSSDLDRLGELPRSYGTDTIFLVAQEPHWLFTYWDIDISRHPGGQTFLRVYEGEEQVESEIEVAFETRNWYIPVKSAGAKYTVEIGYYRSDVWNAIAHSATIQTPSDRLSDSDQFDYATIPLHLSFQKLMESVQTSIRSGETLIQALARLQRDGKLVAFGPGLFPDLPADQRIVLEALLGAEMLEDLSSGSFSSEEIESRIRQHLEEKLSSGNASELLAQGQWGTIDSSFPSSMSVPAGSGASSWGPAALSSWAAAALSSWSAAGPMASSWGPASLSSWLQASQSSWPQAAASSWNQAALSSWSGGSETLSSFGQERSFFMHVNAEVIFYGGTDPRAKVTIDGKPITLNPDGTFRHHFIFPDGTCEIPIVATSPDGVETRSAMLRFERDTHKTGPVSDTAQPALGAPMGGRF